jgi:hypothetical protein
VIESVQDGFLDRVQSEGWPPDGVLRQTQIFDRFVDPHAQAQEKVAYFLVDSMRYEMGCDLVSALASLGEVSLAPAAAVLPTCTAFGMAALMPGADGALTLATKDGNAIPALGDTPLPDCASRISLLRARYGTRLFETPLHKVMSVSAKTLAGRIGGADVVVVRSSADDLPENLSLYQARKYMSDALADLRKAAGWFAKMGFRYQVFAADHGHVLLPEIPAGDVIGAPDGKWALSKRRCRLGHSLSASQGVVILKARSVGIVGDQPELCVPTGFKTFERGEGYFHEGVSLQECVIPVVKLVVSAERRDQEKQEIRLKYKSDVFTSHIIGLKVSFISMFTESVRVRIEAYDGEDAKAKKVGEAVDCDARDETTREILLKKDETAQVPVQIDRDFRGENVEIRAIAPDTGLVWARLKLDNRVMD